MLNYQRVVPKDDNSRPWPPVFRSSSRPLKKLAREAESLWKRTTRLRGLPQDIRTSRGSWGIVAGSLGVTPRCGEIGDSFNISLQDTVVTGAILLERSDILKNSVKPDS